MKVVDFDGAREKVAGIFGVFLYVAAGEPLTGWSADDSDRRPVRRQVVDGPAKVVGIDF